MVEHDAEYRVERKLGMQKHRGFEKEIDLAEATRRGVTVSYVLYSREEMIDSGAGSGCMEYELVRGVKAKSKACSTATHIGRSMALGFGDDALNQLRKVNNITKERALELYTEAMAIWEKRSSKKWRLLVSASLISRYPRLSKLEEAQRSE
jgi:hypothetical protein